MIGAVFEGRYSLNGFLAEGPVFTLYSARDKLTAKDISLRLIKPPFDAEEPFNVALNKAIESAMFIQSPFVERLMNVSGEEGKTYIVGELTRAPSLADRIRKLAPFTPPVAVSTSISIVRGLDAFHKLNLAHGDISGDNVAMMGDGETRLQLGGVWKAYSASATAGILVLPTLAPYLAPEISNGDLPDASSDLYAVGILLFELLTGRKPYQAETGLATAMRHSTEETPRVRSLNPSIPMVLDEVVYKAMAKDRGSRYQTASQLLFDLRQTQDALRFGRNLSWPLNPTTAESSRPTVQVAPRMSAVREVDPRVEAPKKKKERDVPMWMVILFLMTAAALGALVLVNFFIGATSPRLIAVPNLSGLTLSEAQASLRPLHLKAKSGALVANNRVEADRIIDSVPQVGKRLPENSTIVVNLSLGAKEVAVPKLLGMTPDKAREILNTVNLQLDDQIAKVNDPTVAEGTICRQTPSAGINISRSSKVKVALSDPSAAPEDAKANKQYAYDISVSLDKISEPVEVTIQMTDATGSKQVYDERKDPGDVIKTTVTGKGNKATFTIFYDGKQVEKYEYLDGEETKHDLSSNG